MGAGIGEAVGGGEWFNREAGLWGVGVEVGEPFLRKKSCYGNFFFNEIFLGEESKSLGEEICRFEGWRFVFLYGGE